MSANNGQPEKGQVTNGRENDNPYDSPGSSGDRTGVVNESASLYRSQGDSGARLQENHLTRKKSTLLLTNKESCELITPHVGSSPGEAKSAESGSVKPNELSSELSSELSNELSSEPSRQPHRQPSRQPSAPWKSPRVLFEEKENVLYSRLHKRLANIPTRSRQRRQQLYIDLWSGQHWLGLALTGTEKPGMLIPVSNDTALSVSMTGSYRVLNPSVFSN